MALTDEDSNTPARRKDAYTRTRLDQIAENFDRWSKWTLRILVFMCLWIVALTAILFYPTWAPGPPGLVWHASSQATRAEALSTQNRTLTAEMRAEIDER